MSVALSAMQVVLATAKGGRAFENASYGFAVASLFLVAGSTLAVLFIWVVLFVYHLVSSRMNNRHVMKGRERVAESKGGPRY